MSVLKMNTNRWAWKILLWALIGLRIGFFVEAQPDRLPDLVVEKLVLDPVEPEPGMAVTLIATITNQGRGRVMDSFSVSFEANNRLLASRQLPARLDPGKKAEVRVLWTPAEGEHLLRVRVDVFDDVAESNERNNKLEMRVEVRKIEGVRSITLALLRSVGEGLQRTGQAIQVQLTSDLLQLFSSFQSALGAAILELSASADRLSALKQLLPASLAGEAQIQTSDQVARLYRSMASAFNKALEGLQRLNLKLLLEAFQQLHMDLTQLSSLSIEGISLSGLGEALPLMDRMLELIQKLQAPLGGAKDVDVNALVQELLALVGQMGQIWGRVGTEVVQKGQEHAAHFTDAQGQPITRYQSGQELRISVPGAQRLKLEVFNAEGQGVFSVEAGGEQMSWNGTDPQGKLLPPGRYFYRLTIEEPANARIELGQIILS